MKNLKVLCFALFVALIVGLSSCGSSKSSSVGLGVEKVKSPAQIYAEADNKARAWGLGTDYNETVAANIAEMNASAKMAKSIERAIKTATQGGTKRYDKVAANQVDTQGVKDAIAIIEDHALVIASQVVKNVTTAKYNAYLQKNGETTVYVCLEFIGGANALAKSTAEAAYDVVKNQISIDEKNRMESEIKQMETVMYESFNVID